MPTFPRIACINSMLGWAWAIVDMSSTCVAGEKAGIRIEFHSWRQAETLFPRPPPSPLTRSTTTPTLIYPLRRETPGFYRQ